MVLGGGGVWLWLWLSWGRWRGAAAGEGRRPSRYGACPEERLETCFRDAFRHMEKVRAGGDALNCQSYDLFVLCFSFADCSLARSAGLAQAAYRAQRTLLAPPPPAEAFIAVYGHLKQQCSYGCTQETERYCAARMSVADKTANHALMLELRGQQMQTELGMVDFQHGCEEMGVTLRDWAAFRIRLCDFNSAFCFCKKLQLHFRGRCNFHCSTLRAHASLARPHSALLALLPLLPLLPLLLSGLAIALI